MVSTATFPVFDIRRFADRLTPAKGKNRYHCPVCEGDNLTFEPENYDGYTCWNDASDRHRAEIREAVSPWSEVVGQQRRSIAPRGFRKQQQQQRSPARLPEGKLTLAKLPAPATDAPQPQERNDRQRGKVQVTTYRYSETQWVERVQWVNPAKAKGYSKDFFPWHLGADGKPVCKQGEAAWLPYRWHEAIAAAKASGANALMVDEGEGCCEAYRSMGIAAITLQGSKWGEKDLQALAQLVKPHGLTVIFHPDNDPTGEEKAGRLRKACQQVGVPCLLLNPINFYSDLPESGDVVDCLKVMSATEYIQRLEAEIHAAAMERRQEEARHQQRQAEQKQRGQTPADKAGLFGMNYSYL